MTSKSIVENLLAKNASTLKEAIKDRLAQKAVQALDEKKIEIAKSYFLDK